MTNTAVVGSERGIQHPTQMPSHFSFEIDHFYPFDLERGSRYIQRRFEFMMPYIAAVVASQTVGLEIPDVRSSNCVMIDDYEKLRGTTPQEVIGEIVLPAAARAGLRIDYVGREAGCALVGESFLKRLGEQTAPERQANRPPLSTSGWLYEQNGVDDGQSSMAMRVGMPSQKLTRFGRFIDIELYCEEKGKGRSYSCPYLASIWQARRLGAIADPAMTPQPVERDEQGAPQFGDDWDALPAIMQLNDDADPFEAYWVSSLLPHGYMRIEAAVRTILGKLAANETGEIDQHMRTLALAEGLPACTLTDRQLYNFPNNSLITPDDDGEN
jgi:hypothetical protein